jgi:small subunit ribosomal protein S15
MARMYSRAHGKSGSKKPIVKKVPSWIRYKSKEVELLIVKLAKEGMTPSHIGLQLRDVYGIPLSNVVTKKKISQILKEKNLLGALPEDLNSLIKRAIKIRKHLEINKHDMAAKRGLEITDSKIMKLAKYYKNSGRISREWKYDPKSASITVQ